MFHKLIEHRRSVRKYKDRPIEREKIDLLIEVALRSPSSRSFNPWRFIVVDRPDLLEKLSAAKAHGSSFLKGAPLGIVVCADPAKCDVWVEDASIASVLIHFAAESLGLGSCWIQIRKRMYNDPKTSQEYVCELLEIPRHLNVQSIIAIGYPAEQKPPHRKEELQYEKVYFDLHGQNKNQK